MCVLGTPRGSYIFIVFIALYYTTNKRTCRPDIGEKHGFGTTIIIAYVYLFMYMHVYDENERCNTTIP